MESYYKLWIIEYCFLACKVCSTFAVSSLYTILRLTFRLREILCIRGHFQRYYQRYSIYLFLLCYYQFKWKVFINCWELSASINWLVLIMGMKDEVNCLEFINSILTNNGFEVHCYNWWYTSYSISLSKFNQFLFL